MDSGQSIGPYRDPIRALVQRRTGDDVSRVIVDGRTVVEDGHVVGVDEAPLRADAQPRSSACG